MVRRAGDTTKLEAATGFRCETSLVDTVDRMIEFARDAVHAA